MSKRMKITGIAVLIVGCLLLLALPLVIGKGCTDSVDSQIIKAIEEKGNSKYKYGFSVTDFSKTSKESTSKDEQCYSVSFKPKVKNKYGAERTCNTEFCTATIKDKKVTVTYNPTIGVDVRKDEY